VFKSLLDLRHFEVLFVLRFLFARINSFWCVVNVAFYFS